MKAEATMTGAAGLYAFSRGTPESSRRRTYLTALKWAFVLFNSVRMLAYVPTVWAIYTSGDASQHSLWTWCTWLGANVTMAAWLYEQNDCRMNRAVAVNVGNACMCLGTVLLIFSYRLS